MSKLRHHAIHPFLRILIAVALLNCSTVLNAAVVVDAAGPDEDNAIPGLDWGDPTARPAIPPDTSLVNKRFRTIQAALYAIQANLLPNENTIHVTSFGPHPANNPATPVNVPNHIIITRSITLRGMSTTRPLIQGGNVNITARTSGVVTIDWFEISNGATGIYGLPSGTTGPTLNISRCDIHHNSASGIVAGPRAVLNLSQSEVHDNGGNGVYLIDHSTAVITQTPIHDNASSGVIADDRCTLTLNDLAIETNGQHGVASGDQTRLTAADIQVKGNGGFGVLAGPNATATLNDVNFTDNGRTGLQLRADSTGAVSDAEFTDNGVSGILMRVGGALTLDRCRITRNGRSGVNLIGDPAKRTSATITFTNMAENGGWGVTAGPAVDLNIHKPTGASRCVFDDNAWGGIFGREQSNLNLSEVDIKNHDGPGLSLTNRTDAVIEQCLIEANRSSGVRINNCPGPVELKNNVIRGNDTSQQPQSGGGVVLWNGSQALITGNQIINNSAHGSGGGVAVIDASATIGGDPTEANRINGNVSIDGIGGGVFARNAATLVIKSNEINANAALSIDPARPGTGGGVGLQTGCDRAVIHGNTIANNKAHFAGGGVSIDDSKLTLGGSTPSAKNTIKDNTVIDGDGGGVWVRATKIWILGNEIQDNTAHRGGGIFGRDGRILIGKNTPYEMNRIINNTADEQLSHGNPPETMGRGGGVYLTEADHSQLDGNSIIGNDGSGIHLVKCEKVAVKNNWIGYETSAGSAPNQGHGIAFDRSSNCRVGPGNTIWGNRGSGVSIGNIPSNHNTVSKNSITGNRDKGIFLWNFGNSGIQTPRWCALDNQTIEGEVDNAPPGSTIELYRDNDGEGKQLINSTTVRPDRSFRLTGAFPMRARDFTTTVTDPAGNTSEFSRATCLRLDIDSDNNNQHNDPDASTVERSLRLTAPGKVLFWNNDYDGSPDRSREDYRDDQINGGADRQDMAVVIARQLPTYLNTGRLELTVSNRGKTRIFDRGGSQRVGPNASASSYTIPWNEINASDLVFRIEGIAVGRATVSLIYFDDNNVERDRYEVLVTVGQLDIDMDANRSGVVDATVLDDIDEDTWERGANKKGAIVLFNNDDDNSDGVVDCDNDILDGDDDRVDLASVYLRRLGIDPLPAGWRIAVALTQEDQFRLFDKRLATPASTPTHVVVGPGQSENDVPNLAATQVDLEYGLEALEPLSTTFDGYGELTLTIEDAAGNPVAPLATDKVRFRVAPLLFADHTQFGEKLYVSEAAVWSTHPGQLSDAVLRPILGPANVSPVRLPVGNDIWTQDEFEIVYSTTPALSQTITTALDLPRNERLNHYFRDNVLGPDFGHLDVNGGFDSPDYGGNLEVSPPVTGYPFGRIVTSLSEGATESITGRGVSNILLEFLNAQEVQAPAVQINVSWLGVNHVDEVMGFVPVGVGFKIALADPQRAWRLLRTVDPNAPVFASGVWAHGVITGRMATTITDATASFPPGGFTGGAVRIYDGANGLRTRPILARVIGNTATTLTLSGSPGLTPAVIGRRYVVVQKAKHWLDHSGRIALVTAGELLAADTSTPNDAMTVYLGHSANLREINRRAMARILGAPGSIGGAGSIIHRLSTELGLARPGPGSTTAVGGDFIRLPVLYSARLAGGVMDDSAAYTPGVVNLQIFGNTALVPDPFGPPDASGDDVFKKDIRNTLQSQGLTVHFIDDWEYHIRQGEVHCGTNVIRRPRTGARWWE